MSKNILMCLALTLTLTGLSGIALALEPEKDEIIFTTYYPAPYGVYNEFKANRVVVGEDLDTEDLDDGELKVGESIILKPWTKSIRPDHEEGKLYYDDYNNESKFYYSDGSTWEPMGGAGGDFVIVTDSVHTSSERSTITAIATCPTGKTIKSACTGTGTKSYNNYSGYDHVISAMFFCQDSPTHSCVGNTNCTATVTSGNQWAPYAAAYVRILCSN